MNSSSLATVTEHQLMV